jgi:hypothetical protein
MSLQIASPFQQFFDRDGSPLDNGFVYIGTVNLNPETNPLTVYFDDALTIPAAQPLRTSNGYIVRNGSPARLYTSQEDFSLTVRDKSSVLVFSVADATSLSNIAVQLSQFISDLSDGTGSSLVGYNQGGVGAVDRTVQGRLRDSVSVKDFGAVGDGVADDTAAIQAAIDSFATGQGTIYFPKGIYLVTSTITINKDRMNLIGEGQWVSQIRFNPTGDDICIFIGKGGEGNTNGGVIVQCSVKGFTFFSTNSTNKKTALELKDIAECYFDNIAIGSTTQWIGNGSIGVRVRGREGTTFSNMVVQTNRPFVFARNTNFPSICLDHFNFHNIFSACRGHFETVPVYNETNFFFEPGTNFSNVSFTGYQAWLRGRHGLYYDNTVTDAAGTSYSMNIQNVRWEGEFGDDDTGYMFYFAHGATGSARNIIFNSIYGGEIGNGYYFRKCTDVTLINCLWSRNSGESLNIDTVTGNEFLQIVNCFWQSGATATIGASFAAINAVRSDNTAAVFKSAIYTASQGFGRRDMIAGVPVNQGRIDIAAADPTVITLPLDATATAVGTLADSRGKFAIIGFNVVTKTATLIYDDGTWSIAQGTAAKVNVYWDAGSSTWKAENKTGVSRELYFQALGSNQ